MWDRHDRGNDMSDSQADWAMETFKQGVTLSLAPKDNPEKSGPQAGGDLGLAHNCDKLEPLFFFSLLFFLSLSSLLSLSPPWRKVTHYRLHFERAIYRVLQVHRTVCVT